MTDQEKELYELLNKITKDLKKGQWNNIHWH